MKSKALISLLQDGQIHSGESLASQLGISRTAVWKQIHRAVSEGYDIRTVRGKGYQLLSRVDLLDQRDIVDGIASQHRSRVSLQVLDEVDSTNADVLRRWPQENAEIPVSIADCQTAGRGRRGRTWQSPRGENLYLSLGLTFQGGFAILDGLSLVLGEAVANAIEQIGGRDIRLKWPNDIFLPQGKLGGILVELQGELQEGVARVIVGVGINVHMTRAEGVDQSWTSLALAFPEVAWCRNRLAAAVLNAIMDAAAVFADSGFPVFREAWQARDMFAGRPLRAHGGGLEGVGAGVDDAGNYLLQTPAGTVPVRAGEISLRVQS